MPAKPPLSIVPGKAKPKAKAKPTRRRADWEAVERDYRTGKHTLRELEKQHGVTAGQISRKAQQNQWTKDLRTVIKQATDHALLLENSTATQQEAEKRNKEGDSSLISTVLAAAELNKQVILTHRSEIRTVRHHTARAIELLGRQLEAMETLAADPERKKAIDPAGVLLSAQRAAQTLSRLQAMERKAFNLDEEAGRKEADPLASLLSRLKTQNLSVVADDPAHAEKRAA